MPHPIASFLTDFADQAVILPLIVSVAAALWLSGWRRGTYVWFVGTAATLGVMVILKLIFKACGPEVFNGMIESPSGHTAAAGAVYGSIFAFINSRMGGRTLSRVFVVLAVVVAVGASRLLLRAHNLPEVCIGGAIGFVAAYVMLHLAGDPPHQRSVTLSCLPLLAFPLLLHGIHLQAERELSGIVAYTWPYSFCH